MNNNKGKPRFIREDLKNIPDEDVIRGMEDLEVPLIETKPYTEDQFKIDLKDLYHPRSPYTPQQKIAAANAYLITGTSIKAQRYCGIKADIIRDWKSSSTWWPELFQKVKQAKQDELDAILSGTLHHAMGKISDRIENGDERLLKDGTKTKVAISGKDLSIIVSILYDKRALLRGDPTARVENNSNKDTMKLLQDKFEDIARQLEAKPVKETYEVISNDK